MTVASLDALRDIHLPPEPVLVVLLRAVWLVPVALALLAVVGWGLHRYLRLRPQRAAMRALAHLAREHAQHADSTRLARGLSQLLRRYAVARYPHGGIEGLTGSAWLNFLDAHGGAGAFCHGVGATLETRPYRSCGAFDEAALIALVRCWLRSNPP